LNGETERGKFSVFKGLQKPLSGQIQGIEGASLADYDSPKHCTYSRETLHQCETNFSDQAEDLEAKKGTSK
jgi:hypothetical protein